MTGELVFEDVAELLLKAFFSFSLKGMIGIVVFVDRNMVCSSLLLCSSGMNIFAENDNDERSTAVGNIGIGVASIG